jgi:hypothetical protein
MLKRIVYKVQFVTPDGTDHMEDTDVVEKLILK